MNILPMSPHWGWQEEFTFSGQQMHFSLNIHHFPLWKFALHFSLYVDYLGEITQILYVMRWENNCGTRWNCIDHYLLNFWLSKSWIMSLALLISYRLTFYEKTHSITKQSNKAPSLFCTNFTKDRTDLILKKSCISAKYRYIHIQTLRK